MSEIVDLRPRAEKIISSVEEFATLSPKPKKVFWRDKVQGGSFTLDEDNHIKNDGVIWFDWYKREFNEFSIDFWLTSTDDLVDVTTEVQAAIDYLHTKYRNEAGSAGYVLNFPERRYVVTKIMLRGGVHINMRGMFVPNLSLRGESLLLQAGSYCKHKTINIDCSHNGEYYGSSFSIDFTDADMLNALSTDVYDFSVRFNDIEKLNIKGNGTYNSGDTTGIVVKVTDGKSSAYNNFNVELKTINNMLVIENTGDGWFNSNIISGIAQNFLSCVNHVSGTFGGNTIDLQAQPLSTGTKDAFVIRGNNNTFRGMLWDWQDSFGDIVKDYGYGNVFEETLTSAYPNKCKKIFRGGDAPSVIKSKSTHIVPGQITQSSSLYSKSWAGHQDNLLANITKFDNTSVVFSESTSQFTIDYLFNTERNGNHGSLTSWPEADGGGNITVDITLPEEVYINVIELSFYYPSRAARKVSFYRSTDGINYIGFGVNSNGTIENNDDVIVSSGLSGSGYKVKYIRIVFEQGADVTDAKNGNIGVPNGNYLSLGHIAAYGYGNQKAYAEPFNNELLGLLPSDTPQENNTLFVDAADGTLKFKDNSGAIKTISLV